MGIFSFFEQIGNLITSVFDAIVFILQSTVDFFTTITMGFNWLNKFVSYLPGEIAMGFVLLICTSVIYLIVGR